MFVPVVWVTCCVVNKSISKTSLHLFTALLTMSVFALTCAKTDIVGSAVNTCKLVLEILSGDKLHAYVLFAQKQTFAGITSTADDDPWWNAFDRTFKSM